MASVHVVKLLDHKLRADIIVRVFRELKKNKWKGVAVASSGVSGNIIAPQAVEMLGNPLIIVRKKGEEFHGCEWVETLIKDEDQFDYVIVDDLISTGDTVKRIDKLVVAKFPNANLKAIIIYNDTFMYGDHFDVNGKVTPVINVSTTN